MYQASCTRFQPAADDVLPLRCADAFESVFSKAVRRRAIEWARWKNMKALRMPDANRLDDIGIRPWQVAEISRKAATLQVIEPRAFSP
jgi:uncharacterized protein YjiS (DUF1127 family)